jgi:putative transposase
VEVIAHCVWLYFRFPLSFREVEELMLQRGVIVSYETVRRWCLKFGQAYADGLRRRRPAAGDKWHLDEVFVKINGERHYLWRAVDQHGNVLDIPVQSKRDAKAAKRFLTKLMKKQRRVPRVLVTDKLRSYSVAHRELTPSVEHRSHKGLNTRAENSHQPTRQRERAMKGFRSAGAAQRFLSAFSGISPHFRPRRQLFTAAEHRLETTLRFTIWDHITGSIALPTVARPTPPDRTPPHPDTPSDDHAPANVTTPSGTIIGQRDPFEQQDLGRLPGSTRGHAFMISAFDRLEHHPDVVLTGPTTP